MAFIDLSPRAQAPSCVGAINAMHPERKKDSRVEKLRENIYFSQLRLL